MCIYTTISTKEIDWRLDFYVFVISGYFHHYFQKRNRFWRLDFIPYRLYVFIARFPFLDGSQSGGGNFILLGSLFEQQIDLELERYFLIFLLCCLCVIIEKGVSIRSLIFMNLFICHWWMPWMFLVKHCLWYRSADSLNNMFIETSAILILMIWGILDMFICVFNIIQIQKFSSV